MAFLAALLFHPKAPKAPKAPATPPPQAPPPPPPPPAPVPALAAQASAGEAAELGTIKRRRGQASTILTSPLGVTAAAPPARTLGGS